MEKTATEDTSTLEKLASVFTDPKEIEFARKILSAVPDDIKSSFYRAQLTYIVSDADSYITNGADLLSVKKTRDNALEYCKDHQIMQKLIQAGLVRVEDIVDEEQLYVRIQEQ